MGLVILINDEFRQCPLVECEPIFGTICQAYTVLDVGILLVNAQVIHFRENPFMAVMTSG